LNKAAIPLTPQFIYNAAKDEGKGIGMKDALERKWNELFKSFPNLDSLGHSLELGDNGSLSFRVGHVEILGIVPFYGNFEILEWDFESEPAEYKIRIVSAQKVEPTFEELAPAVLAWLSKNLLKFRIRFRSHSN